jgi:hypothetical protein
MDRSSAAIAAMLVSTALYGLMFLVPLVPAPATPKWIAAGSLYVGSYLFFFASVGLVGRQGVAAMQERVLVRVRPYLPRRR